MFGRRHVCPNASHFPYARTTIRDAGIHTKEEAEVAITQDSAIPAVFQEYIERAVRILKEGGCTEVVLFGSAATGKVREDSDIDIAVRGCPEGSLFHLLGRLLMELDRSIDLVKLDGEDHFAHYLQEHVELVRIG